MINKNKYFIRSYKRESLIILKITLRSTLVFFLLFSLPSYGKRRWLDTPYVKFNIGEGWICKSFGVDWLCHHYLQKSKNPAFIVVTAREGLSSDKPEVYIQAFQQNQMGIHRSRIRRISIHRQVWIESFQRYSILKDMLSRYVGTVCCDKSKEKFHVFISFFAHEEVYTKYANQFLRSIKSLQLTKNITEALEQIRRQTDEQRQNMMSYIEKILSEVDQEDSPALEKSKNHSKFFLIGLLLFAFTLLPVFFYYRKIKRRKQEKRRIKKRRRTRKKDSSK